jgi:hypothetical protein
LIPINIRHDFNKDIGGLKILSFEEKFPEVVVSHENACMSYMQYILDIETGGLVEDVAKIRSPSTLVELDRDIKGFPVLPPALSTESLPAMRKLIRSFLTLHYS